MSEFRMPALGADMQFGTIVDWRVKPGDRVKRGDVVALVETEKGVIEVEIFDSGVIESLVVQPGQKVPVGATLAILNGGGETVSAKPDTVAAGPPTVTQAAETLAKLEVAAPQTQRLRVSPLARKRAQELGVDLSSL
ncbi:MAG: biotin/lipoyl-containing protein, partial [Candidatus Binatia bacterium]